MLLQKIKKTIIFDVDINTKIIDKTINLVDIKKLAVGDEITLFYDVAVQQEGVYPDIIKPEILIIRDTKNIKAFKLDVFDKNGLSSDKNLIINIFENTEIIDSDSKKLTKNDIIDKELLVFYAITTFSLPPQAPAEKIIVINKKDTTKQDEINKQNERNEYIGTLSKEKVHVKDGFRYVRLTDVAKDFGFNVEWLEKTKSISMTKGPVNFLVTIGKKEYGYIMSLREFNNAPIIVGDKTFVEESFIDMLL